VGRLWDGMWDGGVGQLVERWYGKASTLRFNKSRSSTFMISGD